MNASLDWNRPAFDGGEPLFFHGPVLAPRKRGWESRFSTPQICIELIISGSVTTNADAKEHE